MVALSQAPELRILIQTCSNPHLFSPKASIYLASMVGKQALSDVLQRIQSRTDSIQLGYSGNTCWEHMLGFWEQQGTHMQIDKHCGQFLWFRANTQSKSCTTMHSSRLLTQAVLAAEHHVRDPASASEIKQLIVKLSPSFKVSEKYARA